MTPPLAGLRVLDTTDIRGALCARILADLGADVIRTTPASDPTAADHRFRNARKRLTDAPAGSSERERLLATADVLVENGGPTADLDRATLLVEHPALIVVALSDFGPDGPRAHWHLEALPGIAASGALHATGFPDGPPTAPPGYLAHDCASVHGALGAVAAVLDRRRTGRGQLVETNTQQAAAVGTVPWSLAVPGYLHINPFLPAEGTRNADGLYIVFPCADGHVRTVLGSPADWDGFLEVLGHPEELMAPEWSDRIHRMMNSATVREIGGRCLADRTRAEVFASAQRHGVPLGSIQTPLEFADHPQTSERAFFHDGLARAPWSFGACPHTDPTPPVAAPEASFEGSLAADPDVPVRAAAPAQLLEGVRVVEFGIAAVVPEMCWMLSELGADVIKIESATKPDVLRFMGLDDLDKGFGFNAACRGRRDITLDLGTAEGRRLALDLCATADIVAENNRGGVMASLGLDYPDVAARNPDVIYIASQGYGRGGPMGEMKAYGPLNCSFAGVNLLFSHPDGPYPCGTSMNHPDHIAGKLLATAALAALDHRDRTGEGQFVEMAQTEVAAYLLGEVFLESIETGADGANLGNRHPTLAPQGVYPAAGDDAWIAITVADDDAWRALERVCGWDHDPALATAAARREAHDRLDERLAAWTAGHDPDEAGTLLQAAGVSAITVMGPLQQLSDEHLTHRGLMDDLHHDAVGDERQPANPMTMSRTELRTAPSAPRLGAHTHEILREVLGLDDEQIAAADAAGALN